MGLFDGFGGGDTSGWMQNLGQQFGEGATKFGDNLNSASKSPLFQFGSGVAGASQQGQGLGGGFAAGAQSLQQGQRNNTEQQLADRKVTDFKQRDAFQAGLQDPSNPLVAAMKDNPQALAALRQLPPDQSAPLLMQIITHQKDLANAASIAQINANAQVGAKNAEFKFQKDYQQQGYEQFMNAERGRSQAQPGRAAPPQPGQVVQGHIFMGGNPADPASWKAQ